MWICRQPTTSLQQWILENHQQVTAIETPDFVSLCPHLGGGQCLSNGPPHCSEDSLASFSKGVPVSPQVCAISYDIRDILTFIFLCSVSHLLLRKEENRERTRASCCPCSSGWIKLSHPSSRSPGSLWLRRGGQQRHGTICKRNNSTHLKAMRPSRNTPGTCTLQRAQGGCER
jgi:hypothetical protein